MEKSIFLSKTLIEKNISHISYVVKSKKKSRYVNALMGFNVIWKNDETERFNAFHIYWDIVLFGSRTKPQLEWEIKADQDTEMYVCFLLFEQRKTFWTAKLRDISAAQRRNIIVTQCHWEKHKIKLAKENQMGRPQCKE